ncbi:hypothetical protein TNIN_444011 [Trichonephila inaurata madagascariensis]|uniref:Uncharacterized protein n=1 Tax=Trichonephila inaurata madagascariensis TaxID=2747483 RepID=A0A8X6K8C4_9ARAC|nr:hypothetical protein TNIN_444011 [Trichonephila inaurata madagascariensis]
MNTEQDGSFLKGRKNEQKGFQCNNRSTFTSLNTVTRWLQGTDVITVRSSSVISAESACQAIRRGQGGSLRDRTHLEELERELI